MLVHFGYTDGTGDYYISIDMDKCDGCGLCVEACPKELFEVQEDDYDDLKAQIKGQFVKALSYICPGREHCESERKCFEACEAGAIQLSWA